MITWLLAGLLAVASVVPVFPYKTYDEIPGVIPAGPVCNGQVMRLESEIAGLQIYTTETRDIFVHFTNGQADYVYFAKNKPGDQRTINIVRSLTLEDARKAYPTGPCPYFNEVTT